MINKYLQTGNNPDATGNFVPWLIKKRLVHAYKFEGKKYDIGNKKSMRKFSEFLGCRSEFIKTKLSEENRKYNIRFEIIK